MSDLKHMCAGFAGLAIASAWLATTPDAQALDEPACSVPGALELIGDDAEKTVVIVGELHGTREGPAFVRELACTYAAEGLRTAVLLELPSRYTQSFDGLTGDFAADRDTTCRDLGYYWSNSRDGRGTQAIARLITDIADLGAREPGLLSLAAYDAGRHTPSTRGESLRDWRYGETIRVLREELADHDVIVMNIGSAHPSRIRGRIANLPEAQSIAVHRIVQRFSGGEAWNRQRGRYAVYPVPDRYIIEPERLAAITLGDEIANFDGFVFLGDSTPSPPVRESGFCSAEG